MHIHSALGLTVRGLLAFASLLAAAGPAAAQTVIQDGTFVDGNWSLTKVRDTSANPGATLGQGTQQSSGGNPGEYRKVTHDWVGPGAVGFAHLFTSQAYNPADQGALDAVKYDFDMLIIDPSTSGTVHYAPLLAQGGRFFRASGVTPTTQGVWLAQSFAGLTAASFSATDGTGAPDFSAAGAPIQFGFYTANGTAGSGRSVTTSGIDNWKVTLTEASPAVPEPGAVLLFLPALGVVAFVRRRR